MGTRLVRFLLWLAIILAIPAVIALTYSLQPPTPAESFAARLAGSTDIWINVGKGKYTKRIYSWHREGLFAALNILAVEPADDLSHGGVALEFTMPDGEKLILHKADLNRWVIPAERVSIVTTREFTDEVHLLLGVRKEETARRP